MNLFTDIITRLFTNKRKLI